MRNNQQLRSTQENGLNPHEWADRAIMGREEYNAAIEAEKAQERGKRPKRGIDEILRELNMGINGGEKSPLDFYLPVDYFQGVLEIKQQGERHDKHSN